MPPYDIAAALRDHLAWADHFRNALNSADSKVFDLDRAYDHTACELGRWLQTDDSRARLGTDRFAHVDRLHQLFHESAFVVASIFTQHMQARDIEPFVVEFETLSTRLVGLLRQAQG